MNKQLTDQVNAVGDKSDGDTRSGKGKKCFSNDQEGHFREKCPARDQACRMCGVIDRSKVKCPRARQRGSGKYGSRGDKGSKGDDGGGKGRHGRARLKETNLVADGNHSTEPTRLVQDTVVPSSLPTMSDKVAI